MGAPFREQEISSMLERFIGVSISRGMSRLNFESNVETQVLSETHLHERVSFEIDV